MFVFIIGGKSSIIQRIYYFYGIAIIIKMLGVSGLAFALGMYLPIELNSPILLGAIVAWLVQRSTKDSGISKLRNYKGTLIASGLIAGGALAGVMDGLVKMIGEGVSISLPHFNFSPSASNWTGLLVFLGLAVFIYLDCTKVKSED